MQLMKSLVFLAAVSICSVKTEKYEFIKLLTDFIVKMKVPTKVSAYICWTTDFQLLLWKELSVNNIPCQIGKIDGNITYSSPKEHQLFLLDTNCNGYEKILNKANQLGFFDQPYRWIIRGQTEHKIFKELYFRLDSLIFVTEPIQPKKNVYKIKTLYKLTEQASDFVENDLAVWNPQQGFVSYQQLSFGRNRTNIMGTNLNVSYVFIYNSSFKYMEEYRNAHIESLSKVTYFMTKVVLRILNATTTPVYHKDWGYRIGNTSQYTGMIGHLQRGLTEIGGTGLFFTADRIDTVEYIAPTVNSYQKFFFKAPPLSYVANLFTLPFETYVWYSCFALVPIIFVIIYIIVKWEWLNPVFEEKVKVAATPLRANIFDVMLLELGAITQQGTESQPQSIAGRLATVFVLIAFMFLFTAYSANIVVLLQSTTDSIRTLEDLLNYKISLGVEDIVYNRHYFETADEPLRKAIYQQKIAPKGQKPNYMNVQEGMSRMQNEFFAFYTADNVVYHTISVTFQENEKCGINEISYINLLQPWMCMRKESAYKEITKYGFRKIQELGIQKAEINRIYVTKPRCQREGNFGSAGIIDCYAAFVIFGIGIVLSIIVLLLEKLIYNLKNENIFGHVSIIYLESFT